MKIGIIGSGDVAKTLASGFLKHGHEVTLGTREAGKLADFAKANPKAKIGRFADAAKFCETVVLAVEGSVASLEAAVPPILRGKPTLPIQSLMRLQTTVSSGILPVSKIHSWSSCKSNSLMHIS